MQKPPAWLPLLAFAVACSGSTTADTNSQDQQAATCDCPLDWQVDNMAVCVSPHTAFTSTLLFSSHLDAAGDIACDSAKGFPQPTPKDDWSRQRIASPCTGGGSLVLRVRQGDPKAPSVDDCLIAEHKQDFDYAMADEPLELAPAEGWSAQDQTCARKYEDEGGYLEFRIESETLGCRSGGAKVKYVAICPVGCDLHPEQAKCKECGKQSLSNRL